MSGFEDYSNDTSFALSASDFSALKSRFRSWHIILILFDDCRHLRKSFSFVCNGYSLQVKRVIPWTILVFNFTHI